MGFDAALAEGETVETRAAHDAVLARLMAGMGDAHLAFLPADAPLRPPTRIVRSEIDREGGALVLRLLRLDPEAARAIDAFAASIEGEAPARPVVIDLRGNTGGNSAVGDRLVATLHGEEALRRFNQTLPPCPVLWRASPRNIAALEAIAAAAPKDRQAGLAAEVAALGRAQAQGRAFARPVAPQCRDPHKPPLQVDRGARAVSVRIDRSCFSSCLLLVGKLWRLGATLLGEPTATGNWYMEVRRTPLPSGLGAITVVQRWICAGQR